MTYVVLQPGSITNHSDRFAIVEYDEWTAFAYGRSPVLCVTEYADTAQLSAERAKALNTKTPKEK